MKDGHAYSPDEVMYNSLLGGCAREQRVTEALELVEDMRARGVAPSNYTLSMLIKLMGRCRMLEQAFSILEDFTEKYAFRANIQVYTCLIQACFQNRQVTRAVSLLDRMLKDGLSPDEKTYTALVRGCMQARKVDQAVDMARRAYQGNRPVGVDSGTIQELVSKLGKSSDAAQALLAEAKGDVRPRPPVRLPPSSGSRSGAAITKANTSMSGSRLPWRHSKTCGGDGRASESFTDGSTSAGTAAGSGSGSGSGNE